MKEEPFVKAEKLFTGGRGSQWGEGGARSSDLAMEGAGSS